MQWNKPKFETSKSHFRFHLIVLDPRSDFDRFPRLRKSQSVAYPL